MHDREPWHENEKLDPSLVSFGTTSNAVMFTFGLVWYKAKFFIFFYSTSTTNVKTTATTTLTKTTRNKQELVETKRRIRRRRSSYKPIRMLALIEQVRSFWICFIVTRIVSIGPLLERTFDRMSMHHKPRPNKLVWIAFILMCQRWKPH